MLQFLQKQTIFLHNDTSGSRGEAFKIAHPNWLFCLSLKTPIRQLLSSTRRTWKQLACSHVQQYQFLPTRAEIRAFSHL